MTKLPVLPCYPCPHRSACCGWGVTLLGDEVETLRRLYGADAVIWDADEQEWRTATVGDRCRFLKDNACTLHARPEYPAICRGFPWYDGEGGPYIWDQTICPEFLPGGVAASSANAASDGSATDS